MNRPEFISLIVSLSRFRDALEQVRDLEEQATDVGVAFNEAIDKVDTLLVEIKKREYTE
jgi:hypothetical protein